MECSSSTPSWTLSVTWWAGWRPRESRRSAEQLIADAIYRNGVNAGQLPCTPTRQLHDVRRQPLLCDLRPAKHSRPTSQRQSLIPSAVKKLSIRDVSPNASPTSPLRALLRELLRVLQTTSIVTPALPCTPRPMFISASPTPCEKRQSVLDAAYAAGQIASVNRRSPQGPRGLLDQSTRRGGTYRDLSIPCSLFC